MWENRNPILTAVHCLQRQFRHGIPLLFSHFIYIFHELCGFDDKVNVTGVPGIIKKLVNTEDRLATLSEPLNIGVFIDPVLGNFIEIQGGLQLGNRVKRRWGKVSVDNSPAGSRWNSHLSGI